MNLASFKRAVTLKLKIAWNQWIFYPFWIQNPIKDTFDNMIVSKLWSTGDKKKITVLLNHLEPV